MTDDIISRTGMLSTLRTIRAATRQEQAVHCLVMDAVRKQRAITQICGFRIDELIMLADILRKNGIRPEDVKESRQIVEMMLDEAQETMRQQLMRRTNWLK